MEISDFFKDIKDRLSSPFISSLIIAWAIFNYKIVVGLIFYKVDQLKIDGYNSYLDLIDKAGSTNSFLIKPVTAALIYTFVYPFFKNVVLAFGAWISRWGRGWTLKINKNGTISVTKYLNLKQKYEGLINDFVENIKSENEIFDENVKLRIDLAKIEKESSENTKEVDMWRSSNTIEELFGNWTMLAESLDGRARHTYEVIFGNGFVEFKYSDENIKRFSIVAFASNTRQTLLSIAKPDGKFTTWMINSRKYNVLSGIDDVGQKLRLTRS